MSAPTALDLANRLLRDIGVVSLDPTSPANQVTPIEDTDFDDIAMVITQGLQELFRKLPAEGRMQPGNGYLRAPTSITLTCVQGSAAISGVSGYSAWMEGCTIRINGDAADNELLSSTLLARPYTGSSGGQSGTVYADAITLDETIEKVMTPVFVAGQRPIPMAGSPAEFMRVGQWSGITDIAGYALLWPFSVSTQKSTGSYPLAWIQDAYYDPTLTYLKRRIRFTPMPTGALALGYTKLRNPPRIVGDDLRYTLTVTGTLTPDATGSYTRLGTLYGAAVYTRDGDYFINVVDGASFGIRAILSGNDFSGDVYEDGWVLTPSSITSADGSYTNQGAATGTATVETTGTASDIPLPITNEAQESLLLPICRQIMTGLPTFKNAAAIGEIARAYKKANEMLDNSMGEKGNIVAHYPGMVRNW